MPTLINSFSLSSTVGIGTNSPNKNLTVIGEVSASRNLFVGGDLNVYGTLFTYGSSIQLSSTNLVVGDPMIYIANNNTATNNPFDIGIVGHFNDSTASPPGNGFQHTGFVRNRLTGNWTLFSGVTTEPSVNNAINWNDPKFKIDTITANLSGGSFITRNLTAVNIVGVADETVFTDGTNLTGNGNNTLTLNYTNGIYGNASSFNLSGGNLNVGVGGSNRPATVQINGNFPNPAALNSTNHSLFVTAPTNYAPISIWATSTGTHVDPTFRSFTSRGTYSTPLPLSAGDIFAAFRGFAYNGSLFNHYGYGGGASINFVATTDQTPISGGARIDFQTSPKNAIHEASPLTRMVINDDGNVGIGTVSPNKTLTVVGDISATGDLFANKALVNAINPGLLSKSVSSVDIISSSYVNTIASATVSFVGGGGTGAEGTVQFSGNRITGVTVTNGGDGYTSPPTLQFNITFGTSFPGASMGTVSNVNLANTLTVVGDIRATGNISTAGSLAAGSNWNQQTTSYVIQNTDCGGIIALSSGGTTALSASIPSNNFRTGFQTSITRLGTGTVRISAAPGVNIRQAYGLTFLSAQYSVATLTYSGNPTVGWLLFGDLA